MTPRLYGMDSSPTPGALIVVSYEDLNNLKEDMLLRMLWMA